MASQCRLHDIVADCTLIHSVCKLLCSCKSSEPGQRYDLVVVGGGIVGMATAREIALRHPRMNIAVLEKENRLGNTIIYCKN